MKIVGQEEQIECSISILCDMSKLIWQTIIYSVFLLLKANETLYITDDSELLFSFFMWEIGKCLVDWAQLSSFWCNEILKYSTFDHWHIWAKKCVASAEYLELKSKPKIWWLETLVKIWCLGAPNPSNISAAVHGAGDLVQFLIVPWF